MNPIKYFKDIPNTVEYNMIIYTRQIRKLVENICNPGLIFELNLKTGDVTASYPAGKYLCHSLYLN